MTDDVYNESFSRNIGILTEREQQKLSESTVAIAGVGGIGGNTLILLARMGIGTFRIADFDNFERVNINRQYGAQTETIGKPKVEVLAEAVKQINPLAEVVVFDQGFEEETADAFLEGADLTVDAIDFYSIETHLAFHRKAREHGLYTLMGSAVGFSACLQIFDPNGMDLEAYCAITPEMPPLEKQLRYACSIVPELLHLDHFDVSAGSSNTDFLNRKGPSVSVACSLAASFVAAEAALILLDRRPPRTIPHTFQFDPYTYRYAKTYVDGGMGHFDPTVIIKKIQDKSAFVPQVLELLYRKKKAEKAPIHGAELYYKVEGEGEPMLLISPLGADSGFWARQTGALAQHFKVITFDNRGSGESTACGETCSTRMLADDAMGLLHYLGIPSAHVVGVALGGLIAQHMAALRPDLVKRLVMASSYIEADARIEAVTRQWRELAQQQGMEQLFDACLEWLFTAQYMANNDGELDKLKTFYRLTLQEPHSFCLQSLAGTQHQGTPLVGAISCPTLVLHGGADRLVDPQRGRALADAVPGGQFTLIEPASHFLVWEHAAEFNAAIVRFLKQETPVAV